MALDLAWQLCALVVTHSWDEPVIQDDLLSRGDFFNTRHCQVRPLLRVLLPVNLRRVLAWIDTALSTSDNLSYIAMLGSLVSMAISHFSSVLDMI